MEARRNSPAMKITVKELLKLLFDSAGVESSERFSNLSDGHRELLKKVLARSGHDFFSREEQEWPPDIDQATELSKEEYGEYLEEFTYLERLRGKV